MSGQRFEALLAPRLTGVRLLVQRRLSRHGDVEDVVQNILLQAYARRHQLRCEESFGSWLWSIALNEIRSFYRRDRGLLSLDDLPNLDVQDPAGSPAAMAERTETARWLRACILKLSERDRAVIWARDLQERNFRDAAAALRRTLPATKTAHFRARQRLAVIARAESARRTALAA